VFAPILANVVLQAVERGGGSVETHGSGFSMGYFAVHGAAFVVSILGSVFVTRIRSAP
jgi:hypothetical protein